MKISSNSIRIILFVQLIHFLPSCKKVVEINQPNNSITTVAAFSSDETALSAVLGIYSRMLTASENVTFATSGITILPGLASDELTDFAITAPFLRQFKQNEILSDNAFVLLIWRQAYSYLYQVNECLAALESAKSIVSPALKNQLKGECLFLRAFIHFYLTNLFGDVPLTTTADWRITSKLSRSNVNLVYEQIIQDLNDAKSLLNSEYPTSNRVRPNKWAATTLLARAYLYIGNWTGAESEANEVISSGLYTPLPALSSVFLQGSHEAIWQLMPIYDQYPAYDATYEGALFIPYASDAMPNYIIDDHLYNSFEIGDNRKINWLTAHVYNGQTYYYPSKYKIRGSGSSSVVEATMMLRCGELYLIRAEARANLNKLNDAIDDLNVIRTRAGLINLMNSLTQSQTLVAVNAERRSELFIEWGHRWFDLKRTNKADSVLSPIKGSGWQSTDKLFPIPLQELQNAPNLTQNTGY
ncbi:MAG: RagB/SusD family nutrient uptake outer membrane protein [Chitinophagaceae bacterium]|nr:RagB/SusD family nutrient uptake outer membrane protein [Chitinophagaceae bacterium]